MFKHIFNSASRFVNTSGVNTVFINSSHRFVQTVSRPTLSTTSKYLLCTGATLGFIGVYALHNKSEAAECHDPICADNMSLFQKSIAATAKMNNNTENQHKESKPSQEENKQTSKTESKQQFQNDCVVNNPNEFTVYDEETNTYHECPPDRRLLGRHSWTLLHSIAAYYPEHPTEEDKQNAIVFLNSFAQLYPCKQCAHHFQQLLIDMPPTVDSQEEFVVWMGKAHNIVSAKCHKRLYPEDYETLQKRWKTGCDCCFHKEPHNDSKDKGKATNYTSEQTMNCEDLAKYYKK